MLYICDLNVIKGGQRNKCEPGEARTIDNKRSDYFFNSVLFTLYNFGLQTIKWLNLNMKKKKRYENIYIFFLLLMPICLFFDSTCRLPINVLSFC